MDALGFGSCVKACPFGAIDVVNGVAVVNKEAAALSRRVMKCPKKHLISLCPKARQIYVLFAVNSHKGKAVTSA